ncbi:MAG: helix-turn-helix transcriptional regulator [Oscillospiraceae bacterium]
MQGQQTLEMLKQLAVGVARQFGPSCEVVVHSLSDNDIESSIVAIENGNVTSRKIGDGPSHVVLEAMQQEGRQMDHLAYLTKTRDGKILKSSTMFVRDEGGKAQYIFAINYDITGMLIAKSGIEALISTEAQNDKEEPERIVQSVAELLDELIDNSVALVGKPVALMGKDDKIRAIQFLNKAGAFLITKSGDKVSKYFGISKYTLYSYIDSGV